MIGTKVEREPVAKETTEVTKQFVAWLQNTAASGCASNGFPIPTGDVEREVLISLQRELLKLGVNILSEPISHRLLQAVLHNSAMVDDK